MEYYAEPDKDVFSKLLIYHTLYLVKSGVLLFGEIYEEYNTLYGAYILDSGLYGDIPDSFLEDLR